MITVVPSQQLGNTLFQYAAGRTLAIRKPLAARDAASCAKDIEAANSVSLHVRRGDYLRSQRHNLCSIAYYNTALDYMRGRTA